MSAVDDQIPHLALLCQTKPDEVSGVQSRYNFYALICCTTERKPVYETYQLVQCTLNCSDAWFGLVWFDQGLREVWCRRGILAHSRLIQRRGGGRREWVTNGGGKWSWKLASVGVEELWYEREIVIAVLPLNDGSDAIKQLVDGRRGGQTHHK